MACKRIRSTVSIACKSNSSLTWTDRLTGPDSVFVSVKVVFGTNSKLLGINLPRLVPARYVYCITSTLSIQPQNYLLCFGLALIPPIRSYRSTGCTAGSALPLLEETYKVPLGGFDVDCDDMPQRSWMPCRHKSDPRSGYSIHSTTAIARTAAIAFDARSADSGMYTQRHVGNSACCRYVSYNSPFHVRLVGSGKH
jgi:hypothetical protein